ncbi:MAG: phosphoenolpyruvate hydrolase family protein [Gammaproteobacteria bacterium]
MYNSGRYRMAGRGSLAGLLAYGNANDIVLEMALALPVVKQTSVIAGVNGTDLFLLLDCFLKQLIDFGFSGVQNFLTVGLIDGVFRANLEETGMGYGLEVDMIRAAHGLDLLTTPYVFNEHDAVAMAEAGADIVVCHMGLTTGGAIGATTALELADCVPRINAWAEAALKVRQDVIVLCHGGPIAVPKMPNMSCKIALIVMVFMGLPAWERCRGGDCADGDGAEV